MADGGPIEFFFTQRWGKVFGPEWHLDPSLLENCSGRWIGPGQWHRRGSHLLSFLHHFQPMWHDSGGLTDFPIQNHPPLWASIEMLLNYSKDSLKSPYSACLVPWTLLWLSTDLITGFIRELGSAKAIWWVNDDTLFSEKLLLNSAADVRIELSVTNDAICLM